MRRLIATVSNATDPLGDPMEVADLFAMDERRVLAIHPGLSPSRARQERLTRALARCEPVVRSLPWVFEAKEILF